MLKKKRFIMTACTFLIVCVYVCVLIQRGSVMQDEMITDVYVTKIFLFPPVLFRYD